MKMLNANLNRKQHCLRNNVNVTRDDKKMGRKWKILFYLPVFSIFRTYKILAYCVTTVSKEN